jgi:ribosomal protein S18 acetylase RimI-like enzyme
MFQVKCMQPQDYLFATELANTMNWNMAPEDFQFNSVLDPQGCLVLFDDSAPVGIATCISYCKVGWFGNLIVKPEVRHRGAGSLLVIHALNYLQGKGATTIGLYAYPHLLEFYGKLGFKADIDFTYMHLSNLPVIEAVPAKKITETDIPAILAFDKECFGGDRQRLLEANLLGEGNCGYFVVEKGEVVGYASANVYERMAEVAPLVCKEKRSDIAFKLLNSIFSNLPGLDIYLCLPKNQCRLLEVLTGLGFKEEFSVTRMYNGPNPAKNCIYLAESLERG